MSIPHVTAIVPTLDRPQWLVRSLAALARARPAFAEVWVADQSAGEDGRALCERFGARWLHLDRRGISQARNAAFPHARTEWVAYPDDDAEVTEDILVRLAETLSRCPDAAFVQARVEYPDRRPMQPGMEGPLRVLDRLDDTLRTAVSPGLFVRRDWVERAGGFDERFGVGAAFPSGEESDLLFRILAAGGRGVYDPALLVHHPDPFAIRDEPTRLRRMADYGVGLGALLAKHADDTGDETYRRLHRRLLRRAWLACVFMATTGRLARARRYHAAWRGRREGWRRWHERGANP
jgi:GT2 family glycosyltransferase